MNNLIRAALFVIFLSFLIIGRVPAQQVWPGTNVARLQELAQQFHERFERLHTRALEVAQQKGWPISGTTDQGVSYFLLRLSDNGKPIYYITHNLNAAKTISTNNVWPGGSAGLSLTGSGMTIGEWDAGRALDTHQELINRITHKDAASSTHYHSTHVAGTLIASGVVAAAKGMAGQATVDDYDWTDDESEMSAAASAGLLISNHSYGLTVGWYWNLLWWFWAGDETIDSNEDYKFGFYNESESKAWDDIAYNAPYYLIVKSAGNDRGEGPSNGAHEVDGGSNGYDCIGPQGVAKNILTVGAVDDITGGYTQPSDVVMSSFSSWGPTDDGRIKPDIVANGVDVYSCDNSANNAYQTLSGTSMAAPNAAGSLALLQQHYKSLSGGTPMRAATLKALVIHTADEAGSADGPDYRFGWGLMNTESAANLISDVWNAQTNSTIQERELSDGGSYSISVNSAGNQPLRATICWTDPPGTPVSPALDPPDIMLVNDLDLRITYNTTTYYPWKFSSPDPNSPSTSATTGDNIRDNVEQVYIANPASGWYTITVNHKGTLQGGSQAFSLIMSGAWYSDQSLPVELTSFSARQVADHVSIAWETQSETHNLGFNILRSASKDGPFRNLASYQTNPDLRGLGSSAHGRKYHFDDRDVQDGNTYWYLLQDVDINGQKTDHGPVSVYVNHLVAESFQLSQNWPNPFNPATNIRVSLPDNFSPDQTIDLTIFDNRGRRIKQLFKGNLDGLQKDYVFQWDGTDQLGNKVITGVYTCILKAPHYKQARKMLLLR